jgi:adenine-specific DNA glycosylase
MLQQTQVQTVIAYWNRWMRALPTVDSLAAAPPETILKLWEGLGYYRRARQLQAAARQIRDVHGGRFPEAFGDILALPGIGRYTAGAICSIAYNQPCPIVDGNVRRVLTRLRGIQRPPEDRATETELWDLAGRLVQAADRLRPGSGPAGKPRRGVARPTAAKRGARRPAAAEKLPGIARCASLNQALMELGATLCTPRQPRCDACPVVAHCVARRHHWQERLPAPARRPATIHRMAYAFVLERRGRFLVRQRPGSGHNAHFWEFPNLEVPRRLPAPGPVALEALGAWHPPVAAPLNVPGSGGAAGACRDGAGGGGGTGAGDARRRRSRVPRFVAATDASGPDAGRMWHPLLCVRHSITRYRIELHAFVAHVAVARAEPVPRRATTEAGERWVTAADLARLPLTAAHRKIARALAEPSAGS